MSKDEAPRFRVNALSHIGDVLVQEGDEVTYTPPKGSGVGEALSPLNAAAQAIVDRPTSAKDHPDRSAAKEEEAPAKATVVAKNAKNTRPTGKTVASGTEPPPSGPVTDESGGAPAADDEDVA